MKTITVIYSPADLEEFRDKLRELGLEEEKPEKDRREEFEGNVRRLRYLHGREE